MGRARVRSTWNTAASWVCFGTLLAGTALASTITVSGTNPRFESFGARFALASTCGSANVVDVTDPSGEIEACDALTAGGTVSTATTLRAGDRVTLRANFNVDLGSSLSVQVDPSLFPDAYVQDDTPEGETAYAARFYLDPASLGLDEETDRFYHFVGNDAASEAVFRLGVTWDALGEVRLFLEAVDDDGDVVSNEGLDEAVLAEVGDPECQTSPGCYQWIEVGWTAATGAGADDGTAYLCVNGLGVGDCKELVGLDTDTRTVDSVRWGVLDVNPGDGGGLLDVDELDSQRAPLVGPSAKEELP
jgi:hypothetical protein